MGIAPTGGTSAQVNTVSDNLDKQQADVTSELGAMDFTSTLQLAKLQQKAQNFANTMNMQVSLQTMYENILSKIIQKMNMP